MKHTTLVQVLKRLPFEARQAFLRAYVDFIFSQA